MTGSRWIGRVGLVAVAALALLGCKDDEPSKAAVESDGGEVSKAAAVDPNLAKAVAEVAEKEPASAADQAGPPENGVFAPGKADAEAKAGQPPKLTLGSTGAEPKLALGGALPQPGKKQKLVVQLALQTGPRQGLPPINFDMVFEAKKPDEEAPAGLLPVVASVGSVGVAPTAQRLPEEVGKAFATMKGSSLSYQLSPEGGVVSMSHELSKKADKGLDNAVRSLGDVVSSLTVPYPSEKVGSGAYWMVTTRDHVSGIDVVSYRMVKVEEVSDGTATLNVDIRRYAVSKDFNLPELAQQGKLELESFEANGNAKLEVRAGQAYPESGQLTMVLTARLIPAAQPDQRMALQSQTRAELDRPAAP